MAAFVGEITQIPPMYSAVKVNGDVYMNMPEITKQWNDLFARPRSIVLSEQVIFTGNEAGAVVVAF